MLYELQRVIGQIGHLKSYMLASALCIDTFEPPKVLISVDVCEECPAAELHIETHQQGLIKP